MGKFPQKREPSNSGGNYGFKGHSSTQNNGHHDQLKTGDLLWEHQQYDTNIRNIRK